MKRIKDFFKLSIIIIPTVVITLLTLENTGSYLYAFLALAVTSLVMTLILYFILKWYEKRKK